LFESVARFEQTPPHNINVGPVQVQVPPEQTCAAMHAVPHAPQLL
jgi:hypothetical protein